MSDKPTSHDLMRQAMTKHGITADDLIERIHRDIGGDRQRIVEVVERFVSGGGGPLAVHAAIIYLVVETEQATVH